MSWKQGLESTGGWKSWLLLFLIWLIIPGGTIIAIIWLLVQEVRIDKELSDYYHTSFGEFIERKRKEKEAKDRLSRS
jgi:hypothetical protein